MCAREALLDGGRIGGRLKQVRLELFGERSVTSFADRLGLNPSTYLNYEKGRIPPSEFLMTLEKYTNVNIFWLLKGEGHRYRAAQKSGSKTKTPATSAHIKEKIAELLGDIPSHIPVIPHDFTGDPRTADWRTQPPSVVREWILPPLPVEDPAAFAVRIPDDALGPRFEKGDIAIISPAAALGQDRPAIVRLASGKILFRRYTRKRDAVLLTAASGTPLLLAPGEIKWAYPAIMAVAVIGERPRG
jgi:transcriptional regulator with XRE-family HTH domain